MKIKRVTIQLPAHLANTAPHDARKIADAVGRALVGQSQNASHLSVNLQGNGQTGAMLAYQTGAQLSKGGRNGN